MTLINQQIHLKPRKNEFEREIHFKTPPLHPYRFPYKQP